LAVCGDRLAVGGQSLAFSGGRLQFSGFDLLVRKRLGAFVVFQEKPRNDALIGLAACSTVVSEREALPNLALSGCL